MKLYLPIIVAGLLLLSACSPFDVSQDESMLESLEERRAVWEGEEIRTYRITYEREETDMAQQTVEVFVVDSAIDSVAVDGQAADPEDHHLTVDRFFDLIAETIREETHQFSMEFNNDYNYPTRLFALYDPQAPNQLRRVETVDFDSPHIDDNDNNDE